MMDIYILRHGQSTANEQRIVCGAMDYPLSKLGEEQAEAICKHLNHIEFTRVYSSPLSRALQTIKTLRNTPTISIEDKLVELDTGKYSHITIDELWTIEPRYRYQGINPTLNYPDGECLNDMLKRICKWYITNSKSWGYEEKILISGHEGTVCGIMHHLLNLEVKNYPTFNIKNCDYIHITINLEEQTRYRFVSLQN